MDFETRKMGSGRGKGEEIGTDVIRNLNRNYSRDPCSVLNFVYTRMSLGQTLRIK